MIQEKSRDKMYYIKYICYNNQRGHKKNGYRIYNFPTSRGEKMEKEKQSQLIENKASKKEKEM